MRGSHGVSTQNVTVPEVCWGTSNREVLSESNLKLLGSLVMNWNCSLKSLWIASDSEFYLFFYIRYISKKFFFRSGYQQVQLSYFSWQNFHHLLQVNLMVLLITLYLVKAVKCSVVFAKVKITNLYLFHPLFFICWDPIPPMLGVER